MSSDSSINSQLDLQIARVIRAPRSRVWKAWTDPVELARWLLPEPMQCRVEQLEVEPGGAFVTSMSEDGETFVPHLDACIVAAESGARLVFTNGLDSKLRPATPAPVAMTAEVTFGEHPEGTDYRVVVRHADAETRALHEEMGFVEGWGAVTAQLAALVEQ